jgi:7-cyano-7-deazaguanine synthase
MPKAVVLLSGGLDSCVTAAIAVDKGYTPLFVNVYYGQRHSRERSSAFLIAEHYGAEIHTIDINQFGKSVARGTILTGRGEVPIGRTDEEMSNGKAPSYVPGRNTIMLAIGQSIAEAHDCEVVFCGVNAVDYSGYVDCRPAFIAAFNQLAEVATFRGLEGHPIWVEAPLIEMSKEEIVRKGVELKAPLQYTWSCYAGGKKPCGGCDSCVIRARAFFALDLRDPALEGLAHV